MNLLSDPTIVVAMIGGIVAIIVALINRSSSKNRTKETAPDDSKSIVPEKNIRATSTESSLIERVHKPFFSWPSAYTLRSKFVGRVAELKELDDWLLSDDNVLIVKAMGGMGKSALTWEWATNPDHAVSVFMPEGIFWYNFYEKGTTLESFIYRSLAYVTDKSYDEVRQYSYEKAFRDLVDTLHQHQYLFILDGLERILVAYDGPESMHQREVDIKEKESPKYRRCIKESDDVLLRQLISCKPSKILISTRLIPVVYEEFKRSLPYVRIFTIKGLQSDDAVYFANQAGIKKASQKNLLSFLSQFGNHPVLIKAIAGLVANNQYAEGDFDDWYQRNGQEIQLSGIVENYDDVSQETINEILNKAIADLTDEKKLTLAMLAVYGEAITAHILLDELNQYLPPRAEKKDLPPIPALLPNPLGSRELAELERLKRNRGKANTQADDDNSVDEGDVVNTGDIQKAIETYDKQIDNQKKIDSDLAHEMIENNYRTKIERDRVVEYRLKKLKDYERDPKYIDGRKTLIKDLEDLEVRGLIEISNNSGERVYDLHPLVRAFSTDKKGGFEQAIVNDARRRVLGELTKRQFVRANNYEDLQPSLKRFKEHLNLEEYDLAMDVFSNELHEHLYDLGRYADIIQCLTPLIHYAEENPEKNTSSWEIGYRTEAVAACNTRLSNYNEALRLFWKVASQRITSGQIDLLVNHLVWIAETALEMGSFHYADNVISLAEDISVKLNDPKRLYQVHRIRLRHASFVGDWSICEDTIRKIEEISKLVETVEITDRRWWTSQVSSFNLACVQYSLFRNRDPLDQINKFGLLNGPNFYARMKFKYFQAAYSFREGVYDRALELIDSVIEQARISDIIDAPFLSLRAEILAQKKLRSEAQSTLSDALMAVELCGRVDKVDAYNRIARVLFDLNNKSEAIRYAKLAYMSANSLDGKYWYGLEESKKLLGRLGIKNFGSIDNGNKDLKPIPYENEINHLINDITPITQSNRTSTIDGLTNIKNLQWFQIGVIAYFDINNDDDWTKMVSLSKELYSLSDDPGPVIPSGTDTLVNPDKDCSYIVNCLEHKMLEELDLRFLPQARRHDAISIVYVVAQNENEEVVHFFMSLRSEKIISFYQMAISGKSFNLTDYGRIVHGPFENAPSKEDIEMMFDNWLFVPYYLPVKLISRKAGGD